MQKYSYYLEAVQQQRKSNSRKEEITMKMGNLGYGKDYNLEIRLAAYVSQDLEDVENIEVLSVKNLVDNKEVKFSDEEGDLSKDDLESWLKNNESKIEEQFRTETKSDRLAVKADKKYSSMREK